MGRTRVANAANPGDTSAYPAMRRARRKLQLGPRMRSAVEMNSNTNSAGVVGLAGSDRNSPTATTAAQR